MAQVHTRDEGQLHAHDDSRPDLGRGLKHGAIGGVIAGLIFPMFEMAMAAVQGDSPLGPLRMIGGIALGEQALDPSFSILVAGAAGMMVHMMLSVAYGVAFGAAAVLFPAIVKSPLIAALAGAVVGTVLWLSNFYVAAPIFGWNWFPEMTDPLIQFVAHAGFFGVPLGLYVAWALNRHRHSPGEDDAVTFSSERGDSGTGRGPEH